MKAFLLTALAPLVVHQDSAPGPATSTLERVVVLGASGSAGFDLETELALALEASITRVHGPVRSQADEYFFSRPLQAGPGQVEQALEAEPTLVVALDFLFWFGYGRAGADGAPLASEEGRLALLEKGLACLAELECPLVVADFPDMSGAIGKMLAQEQVPAPETLARLSKRVREWAAERGQTIVLPLADIVRQVTSEQAVRIGRHEFRAGTRLLQSDQLHPTVEGLAALAQLVADELVRARLAAEADFTFEFPAVLAALQRVSEAPAPAASRGGW